MRVYVCVPGRGRKCACRVCVVCVCVLARVWDVRKYDFCRPRPAPARLVLVEQVAKLVVQRPRGYDHLRVRACACACVLVP